MGTDGLRRGLAVTGPFSVQIGVICGSISRPFPERPSSMRIVDQAAFRCEPGGLRFRNGRYVLLALLSLLFSDPARAAEVPTPESHLGYRAGADFHLPGWQTVIEYFRKVDAASPRVALRELGRTTEDRPYVVAIVSQPETIANLKTFQDLQHRLTDPRLVVKSSETEDPVAASKPVVVITCSIHSTETASTLMAMELLHELASRDDAATREILDKTILLLVPSANPDGVDKVAKWYERSKGHPWEGSGMPELYHKYAGHDTNRDWFMLNLKETRLLTHLLYHEWYPTILYDVHQMGSKGARLFVPPFHDPINPNLDPKVHQGIFMIGAHMAGDLADAGKRGVLTNAMYDNWWNGGNRTTPQRHNIVAVLTEAASVRMATPIFLDKEDLRGESRGFRDHAPAVNFVDPWAGGWWRLRDIVDYELICARSLLTLASRYKTQFQTNLRDMGREAVAKGKTAPPFAWIVPADQRDPGTAVEMLRILHHTGIDMQRAKKPFQAGGVTYEAESWVLPAAQPYRAHLKDMMEPQVYPARFNAKGEAEAPYDVAGWTLPLQMGVRVVTVDRPFDTTSETLERIEPAWEKTEVPDKPGPFYTIMNRVNDDFALLNSLLAAGVNVEKALPRNLFSGLPQFFEKGLLRFPRDQKSEAVLNRVLPDLSITFLGESEDWPASVQPFSVEKARVAVYQPWVPSMDEGWTRLVLEKFRFEYTTLHNSEIRAGDLYPRFDSLILPSIETKVLRDGYSANQTEPVYVGGIGREGAQALRAFVEAGGTLVCLEDSCEFVIEELALPVTNVLKDLKPSTFFAPGSIVRLTKVKDDWLTSGVLGEVAGYVDRPLAFRIDAKKDSNPGAFEVLQYAKDRPLLSGWLLGPEQLQGKAALVVVKLGRGRVILFGFSPQHRGQPHGTFRLLFNALISTGLLSPLGLK